MNNVNVGEEIKKYIEDCKSNIKYYDIKNNTFYNAEKIIKDDGKIEIKKRNNKDIKIKKITTSQLRLLLSNAVIIKNKIQIETRKEDKISEKLENEIKYLLVKHIYQCGRDLDVKSFDENFKISEAIKEIGNSAKNFNKFYRYLEEIVAYMKYYGFDDK
ncbi:type III-A CRISPR-associated protein Csm2 [Fusobacterium nucleatum]|uniref:type III-A CRISPR-associated protein Csm2 n=1 Tax=Fusobacterium nucleatum TaxID=851 RepID=UPI0030D238CD